MVRTNANQLNAYSTITNLAIFPASCIVGSIDANELALPIGQIVGPVSFIDVTIGIDHVPFGVSLAILPAT